MMLAIRIMFSLKNGQEEQEGIGAMVSVERLKRKKNCLMI